MGRYMLMGAAVALAGVVVLTSSPAGAKSVAGVAGPGGGWGKAEEVPGFAALNTDGVAQFNSVSCGSAGNCSAGGSYLDSSVFTQAFVVSQVHGVWRTAEEVPGLAALNKGGGAYVAQVACGSAGNCSAGGTYTDGSGNGQAFVVSQVHGVWGTAEEVPGTAALNKGGQATVLSVSCASAGNCSAVGHFAYSYDGMGDWFTQAFVVSEVHGRWGKAEVVPGLAALNTNGFAQFNSVSCASAGNCSAGGSYAHRSGGVQAFVDSEVHGKWGKAEEVPGTAALNKGGSARIDSVSCASAGNCSAIGGYWAARAGHQQLFAVSQVNGRWRAAEEVPGLAALNKGSDAEGTTESVSCGSAGNCSAGGSYADSSGSAHAFVDSQVNGRWREAEEVPGIAALSNRSNAGIYSVSCASAGNCSAGGNYIGSSSCTVQRCSVQGFVVSQVNGRWRTPEALPGLAALNKGNRAWVSSVSCASAGHCSAGGTYTPAFRREQAFVVSQT